MCMQYIYIYKAYIGLGKGLNKWMKTWPSLDNDPRILLYTHLTNKPNIRTTPPHLDTWCPILLCLAINYFSSSPNPVNMIGKTEKKLGVSICSINIYMLRGNDGRTKIWHFVKSKSKYLYICCPVNISAPF